ATDNFEAHMERMSSVEYISDAIGEKQPQETQPIAEESKTQQATEKAEDDKEPIDKSKDNLSETEETEEKKDREPARKELMVDEGLIEDIPLMKGEPLLKYQ